MSLWLQPHQRPLSTQPASVPRLVMTAATARWMVDQEAISRLGVTDVIKVGIGPQVLFRTLHCDIYCQSPGEQWG
jgi:hypothetical protein